MEEKELLQKLVEESNSFSEILRKLGKAVSGASIKLLKNKLEEYGIKTLFISESLYSKQPKALSEILVENSNYKAQDLKRRLIKEGLKKDICPNCHSQTDTFANKKNKKVHHCIDCGKEISSRSTRCQSCAAKYFNSYKVAREDRPTKEQLLELILSKPFLEIGRMYGVTDNTIRKWCKAYELPYRKKELKELYQ